MMSTFGVEIIRYKDGKAEHLQDLVIKEEWLDLYVNGELLLQTPLSGGEAEELIHGFLFIEGYIGFGERLEIEKEYSSFSTEVRGEVKPRTMKELVDCASSKIEFGDPIEPLVSDRRYSAGNILRLAAEFQRLPSLYHRTGGVHMAAFAREEILHSSDDISRRNAVDKVIGKVFLSAPPGGAFAEGLLLSSGRISSDIVVRMIHAGVPLIISKSAPTDKAVRLADYYGVTLCGFARGARFNVYTHSYRIDFE
ncbi:MAG: formate dehydrogenase accessory sulfurtransferase FdhD [Sediminispirochaetaceae bacterium]